LASQIAILGESMLVPDEVRKCVLFVGYQSKSGDRRLIGTAFAMSRLIEGINSFFCYIVTAKHIIEEIKNKSANFKIYFRVNLRGCSYARIDSLLICWNPPENTKFDVAFSHPNFPADIDLLTVGVDLALTQQRIEEESIGIGDEVYLVGLFSQHFGSE